MPRLTRMMLALFVSASSLHGCSQTGKVIANNGAGFSLNNLNRPALAAVINLDLPAAKRIIANDETCKTMPACDKGK